MGLTIAVSENTSGKAIVSQESLCCLSAGRSKIVHSSRELAWTSLLLDQHRIAVADDEYESVTPDQAVAVLIRGGFKLESYNDGIWRAAHYTAGTVGLTPGGKVNRLNRRLAGRSKSVEMVKIYLPAKLMTLLADEYRCAGQRAAPSFLNTLAYNDPAVVHSVLAILHASQAGATELYAETAAQWLATHLLTSHSPRFSLPSRERDPGYIADKRLASVLEYISVNLATQLTLCKLAQEAGISKYHFVKLFKQATGRTPHAFVTQMRLETGMNWLVTTDMSVSEIAFACGYERPTHVATAFSARFGMTSSAARDRR